MKTIFYRIILPVAFYMSVGFASFAQTKDMVSIYDIQYTSSPGGGTFPSPYEGQIVTTGGIVTGTDYSNGRFFIGSSSGGAWNGIYVYNNDYSVSLGDSVLIEGLVYEYNGLTELKDLVSLSIESSGNDLPAPVQVTTQAVSSDEAYESVLVQVNDVAVTQTYDEYDNWVIDDGTGGAYVFTGFVNLANLNAPIIEGYPFESINGIVSYFYDSYLLNPRNMSDLNSTPNASIISVPSKNVYTNEIIEIPIDLTFWGELQQAAAYEFTLEYNPEIILYDGYEVAFTLSQEGNITVEEPWPGTLDVQFVGDFSFMDIQTLLKLNFSIVNSGVNEFNFSSFTLGGSSIDYFSCGQLTIDLGEEPIGDTITTIQRPLMNIPEIVVPNEPFNIACIADPSATNWTAALVHENKSIPIDISGAYLNTDLNQWQLTASAATPQIYELYDLVVWADNIIPDTAINAVNLISQRKSSYSFIHLTDSHLPTHIFYPNAGYLSDTSEMTDLREVIHDINLIHPEFVLFTGDIINEGEMEDFENRRVYSKAQRLLSELEVPVFLTAGNHDIGGWESSPPVQGTARRDWWRFFGWKFLENPPTAQPYYTQNFSFDYGPIHFTGLEAYDNYDNFMYSTYGSTSFTDGQMEWLANDLNQSGAEKSVVFYHYDFKGQINLVSMGIDLALWGHTHSNSEDHTPPYNISTAAVCDDNRAYRIINVEEDALTPEATVYAGSNGSKLQLEFSPSNNGTAETVTATISNNQPLDFSDMQIKFVMPNGNYQYAATNGTISQIDQSGGFTIVYVQTDIEANASKSVHLNATLSDKGALQEEILNFRVHPNPIQNTATIEFYLKQASNVEIVVYSPQGEIIQNLENTYYGKGNHSICWSPGSENRMNTNAGVYFLRINTAQDISTAKAVLISK